MHSRDRDVFAQALLAFALANQLEIPHGSAELFWVVLQPYPLTLVERGLQSAMRRRWSAFPPPSALAELIEEAITQAAERRWLQVQEAVREVGPHHSMPSRARRCAW